MTDIVKKETPSILSYKSFAEVLEARRQTTERCLLLDCSGSMDLYCRDGMRRIDHLRSLASDFENERKFAFNYACEEVQEIPAASGGTNMAVAFNTLKAVGVKHAVIITDGEPDSPNLALEAAVGLRLDILYVGDQEPPPEFLQRLANLTGGKFGAEPLEEQKQLTDKIRGLLMGGKS